CVVISETVLVACKIKSARQCGKLEWVGYHSKVTRIKAGMLFLVCSRGTLIYKL
ncbi:unnamed protein product, partial [Brassica oleracea var. botrytis]